MEKFGRSLAVSDDVLAVGATGSTADDGGQGFVFGRDETGWQQRAVLVPDSETNYAGHSIALGGEICLLGSYNNGAFVFRNADGQWGQEAAFLTEYDRNDWPGMAVEVAEAGSTVLVGIPAGGDANSGLVDVFTHGANGWARSTELEGDSRVSEFGMRIAASGQTLAISDGSGGVEFFRVSQGQVSSEARIVVDDETVANEPLVDVSGDRAVVSPLDVNRSYVYRRSGGEWTREAELTPPDGDVELLGRAVAIESSTAVLTTPRAAFRSDLAGYVLSGANGWSVSRRLRSPDVGPRARFGSAVALTPGGETAFVSSHGEGAVYQY
ncbi:MAG: hypothetical protein ABEJ89_06145 [Haloarculaceae archaeon]